MLPPKEPTLGPGTRVRFLPPPARQAFDAGLAGKTGIVVGERWGKVVRVKVDDDGRTWLTFPERLEVVEEGPMNSDCGGGSRERT